MPLALTFSKLKITISAQLCCALILSTIFSASATLAQQEFELPSTEFVALAFNGNPPDSQRVWIRGELKEQVETVLQHRATFLRTEFWLNDNVSVWILDEVGKEKPITCGIVVVHEAGSSRIQEVKVLAFRESRGWEVKHSFFTDQFRNVRRLLNQNQGELSPSIDGITGATLSVRAVSKLAEIALLLDEHIRDQ